jgi:hypothetical protein
MTATPDAAPTPADAPVPQPVAVTVTAPAIPRPVVNPYTQFILTVIALILAVVAGLLVLNYSRSLKSIEDLVVFNPNGWEFDETPLVSAIHDELHKQMSGDRFMPTDRVFLGNTTAARGKNGTRFVWPAAVVEKWTRAGFITVGARVDVAKLPNLSSAERKRLSDAGIEASVMVTPTSKGAALACDEQRRLAFGWACLEARLGDFNQVRIARTEWGKKGINHYRLILATFEINPTEEMKALSGDETFWGMESALVLRHDPFRDTWKVVAFAADRIDDIDLDTSEVMKIWSTMDR